MVKTPNNVTVIAWDVKSVGDNLKRINSKIAELRQEIENLKNNINKITYNWKGHTATAYINKMMEKVKENEETINSLEYVAGMIEINNTAQEIAQGAAQKKAEALD